MLTVARCCDVSVTNLNPCLAFYLAKYERQRHGQKAIYQAKQNERDGVVTMNQMHKLAEAMEEHLIYAVVPNEGQVE